VLFEDSTEVVRFHSQPEQLRSDTTAGALRALRELSRAVVVERLLLKGSRIIPGDWGKAVSGWLAWPLWRS
jgi:hypothetical protein